MTIGSKLKRMSTIALGGLCFTAVCDSYLFNSVDWATVMRAFTQTLGLLHARSSFFIVIRALTLVFAAAGTKLVMPAVSTVAQGELLHRYFNQRLRIRGWWSRGLRHRQAQRGLIALSLNRRSYTIRT